MVRGIEKRKIFLDDTDRESFVKRLSDLLVATKTECLAWSLMTNHFHLLLRSGSTGLPTIMRRLLTGYAINFNQRHKRAGHLFQNRYKSIICEEDPYLLELVRYIHLNPLRSKLVKTMGALENYPWSGHAVIMGSHKMEGQAIEAVLSLFGKKVTTARGKYRAFVEEGIAQGRREDLVGGGLRRSQGTTVESGEIESFDDRVLGSGEFVEHLRHDKELYDKLPLTISLNELIERVAKFFGVESSAIKRRRRLTQIVEARGVICFLAVREIGYSGVAVGQILNMNRSGVCIAARRGEVIMHHNPEIKEKVLGH